MIDDGRGGGNAHCGGGGRGAGGSRAGRARAPPRRLPGGVPLRRRDVRLPGGLVDHGLLTWRVGVELAFPSRSFIRSWL